MEIKSISPILSQIVLRNLGIYCSERLSVDIYSLMEAIHILIADYGEENLIKIYSESGRDWNVLKKRITEIDKRVMAVKVHYDAIEDKKLIHKDKEKELKRFFLKYASKVALLQWEIYDLFVFLVKNNTIQRMTIPNEALKILEHVGYRKFDIPKRPMQSQTQSQPDIIQQS